MFKGMRMGTHEAHPGLQWYLENKRILTQFKVFYRLAEKYAFPTIKLVKPPKATQLVGYKVIMPTQR